MLWIFGALGLGMGIGFLIRNRKKLLKIIDAGSGYLVYLLLFLLGAAVAKNPEVIKNFLNIGATALCLTLGAVGGSVFLAFFLSRFFFKRKNS